MKLCYGCGKGTPEVAFHLSHGGQNYIDNMQPLCVRCNVVKGARFQDYRTREVTLYQGE